jgi:hypothetical protein
VVLAALAAFFAERSIQVRCELAKYRYSWMGDVVVSAPLSDV